MSAYLEWKIGRFVMGCFSLIFLLFLAGGSCGIGFFLGKNSADKSNQPAPQKANP